MKELLEKVNVHKILRYALFVFLTLMAQNMVFGRLRLFGVSPMILPAAAGRNLAKTSRGHAGWSVGIALVSGLAGLTASYYLDTSAGATIVLVSAVFYAVSLLIRSIRK